MIHKEFLLIEFELYIYQIYYRGKNIIIEINSLIKIFKNHEYLKFDSNVANNYKK